MRTTYIELLGQRHPLCFSLAASQELDDAFGGLERMQEALASGRLSQAAAAVDTALSILLRAGRTYAAAMGEDLPPELPCRPAEAIDASSGAAIRTIFSAITGDAEREVETAPKKEEAAPGA